MPVLLAFPKQLMFYLENEEEDEENAIEQTLKALTIEKAKEKGKEIDEEGQKETEKNQSEPTESDNAKDDVTALEQPYDLLAQTSPPHVEKEIA